MSSHENKGQHCICSWGMNTQAARLLHENKCAPVVVGVEAGSTKHRRPARRHDEIHAAWLQAWPPCRPEGSGETHAAAAAAGLASTTCRRAATCAHIHQPAKQLRAKVLKPCNSAHAQPVLRPQKQSSCTARSLAHTCVSVCVVLSQRPACSSADCGCASLTACASQ